MIGAATAVGRSVGCIETFGEEQRINSQEDQRIGVEGWERERENERSIARPDLRDSSLKNVIV